MVDDPTGPTADLLRDPLTTTPTAGEAMKEARAFIADTTELSITDSFSALFENPTADTAAVLYAVVTNSDTEATPPILRNPDGDNVPTAEREYMCQQIGSGATPQMNLYAENTAGQMTAGTGENLGVQLTVTSGYEIRSWSIMLLPGQSIGFSTPSATLSDASVKMSLFFYEEAL